MVSTGEIPSQKRSQKRFVIRKKNGKSLNNFYSECMLFTEYKIDMSNSVKNYTIFVYIFNGRIGKYSHVKSSQLT